MGDFMRGIYPLRFPMGGGSAMGNLPPIAGFSTRDRGLAVAAPRQNGNKVRNVNEVMRCDGTLMKVRNVNEVMAS